MAEYTWINLLVDIVFVLETIKTVFVQCLGYFSVLIQIRFVLIWFPNINPYTQPFFIIRMLTDFYVSSFEVILPPLFGSDLSLVTSSLFLEWVRRILSSFTILDLINGTYYKLIDLYMILYNTWYGFAHIWFG